MHVKICAVFSQQKIEIIVIEHAAITSWPCADKCMWENDKSTLSVSDGLSGFSFSTVTGAFGGIVGFSNLLGEI